MPETERARHVRPIMSRTCSPAEVDTIYKNMRSAFLKLVYRAEANTQYTLLASCSRVEPTTQETQRRAYNVQTITFVQSGATEADASSSSDGAALRTCDGDGGRRGAKKTTARQG